MDMSLGFRSVLFVLLFSSVAVCQQPKVKEPSTSLRNPRMLFTPSPKPYAVIERAEIRMVVVDNSAVDDEILHDHKAGYSGVAFLGFTGQTENLFVERYAGLNFEHIHDGTTRERPILFEPRNAPMELRLIDEFCVELYQPATPNWGLESCHRYSLLEDGTIELMFESYPTKQAFRHNYIGLFWASYINKPDSKSIHFFGKPKAILSEKSEWIEGITPRHGVEATHLYQADKREFKHDSDFPLTLVYNESKFHYVEPFFYGVSRNWAFIQAFRTTDSVRFSQSPSGGGDQNPAWDFQAFVEPVDLNSRFQLVMKAKYLPFESHEKTRAIAKELAASLDSQ